MANFDDIFTAPAEQKKEQNEQKKPRRNNRGRMNPDEWAAKKKAERLAAYELADKTTGEIFADGNRFTEYLDLQSRLDRYSVTNVLLVLAHNPNATQLRSKASWAEEGASILQDQKAIPIIEPGDKFYRDDDTRGTYYNVKWVYDISQTDAKSEPTPTVNRDERQMLSALIAKRPVPIELSDTIENGAVYDHTQKKIFVRKGMEAPDIFRSLSLALARAEMANDTRNFSNENADFKAYCASYMLCRKYGIDVSGYDFREMPDVDGAEPQAIRGELAEIRDVMRTMSARMYKAMEQNKVQSRTGQGRDER